jgi:hypothetical protein
MTILPFVLRVLGSVYPQAYAQDLLELCSSPSDTASIGTTTAGSPTEQLMRSLWDNVQLSSLRLRYVLALWASVSPTNSRIGILADVRRITKRRQISRHSRPRLESCKMPSGVQFSEQC